MTTAASGQPENRLLASLSLAATRRLHPFLARVSLQGGQVLNKPRRKIEYVYFPCSGIVALMIVMLDGRAIETAIISQEGAVGAMAARDQLNPLRASTHMITRMGARSVVRGRAVWVRHHDVRTSYPQPAKQRGGAATLTMTRRRHQRNFKSSPGVTTCAY